MQKANWGIVILSYNHPEITERAVSSVLDKNINPEKVFVVHNGSENTHYLKIKEKFPFVQHFKIEKNLGFSGGANLGLRKAFQVFDQILFLTNDTQLIEWQWPEEIIHYGAPLILKRSTEFVDSIGAKVDIVKARLSHIKNTQEWNQLNKQEVLYAPGTALLLSKDFFLQTNGFDELFHTYWEDVDLGIRAHLAHFKLANCSFIKIKHAIGKTCHKKKYYTFYLFHRNRRWFMEKHNFASTLFYFLWIKDFLRVFLKSFGFNQNFKTHLNWAYKVIYEDGRYSSRT